MKINLSAKFFVRTRRIVFVSREVRDACTGTELVFEPMGSEKLKGFSEPVQLLPPLVETGAALKRGERRPGRGSRPSGRSDDGAERPKFGLLRIADIEYR